MPPGQRRGVAVETERLPGGPRAASRPLVSRPSLQTKRASTRMHRPGCCCRLQPLARHPRCQPASLVSRKMAHLCFLWSLHLRFCLLFFQLFFFARFLTWFQNPVLSSTQHFLSFLGPTWRKCWPNLRNVHERSEIRTNGGLGIPRDLSFFVNPWKDPRVRSCTEWGEPPRV